MKSKGFDCMFFVILSIHKGEISTKMAPNRLMTIDNTTGRFGHIYQGQHGTDKQEQVANMKLNLQSMSSATRVLFICIYAAIFLLGVTGNAVVCWVIGKKKEKSGSDVFMVSLAFADMVASAFVPIEVIQDVLGSLRWYLGSVMCEIMSSISPISLVASSWLLVLIAADRFRIIVTPMKRRISTRIKLCGIIFTWVIAIAMSLPFVMRQKYRYLRGEYFCLGYPSIVTLQQNKHYIVLFAVIGWAIPISIVTILYSLCIRKLLGNSFNNDNHEGMRRRILENKNVSKMFIIVATFFCACTLPYTITMMIIAYTSNSFHSNVLFFSFAMSNMNCCMNPFIYAIRQPEIKTFVKMKWRKLRCTAIHSDSQRARRNMYPVSAFAKTRPIAKTVQESYTKYIT